MGNYIRSGGIRLNIKNKWKYKSLKDSDYIKDRDELFRKNKNGWWLTFDTSYSNNRIIRKKVKS